MTKIDFTIITIRLQRVRYADALLKSMRERLNFCGKIEIIDID